MTIRELCGKVRDAVSLQKHAEEYVFADMEYREMLLDMERDRLFRGEWADGSQIEPPYKPFTSNAKAAKGLPDDRVTLFDTGAFYGAFTVEMDGHDLLFTSADPKTGKLVEKYGEGIFGLSDDDRKTARKRSRALVREWFRAVTGI